MNFKFKFLIAFIGFVLITSAGVFAMDESKFKMTLQVGNPGGVSKIAFTKNGMMFATVNIMNKTIKIWNNKAKLLRILDNGEDLNNCEMDFSPDGKYLAVSNYTSFKIYDIAGGEVVTVKGSSDIVYRMFNSIVFSGDGKYVYTGTYHVLTTTLPTEVDAARFEADLKTAGQSVEELKASYTFDKKTGKYILNAEKSDHSNLYAIMMKLKFDITKLTMITSNCVEQWDMKGNFVSKIGDHNNDASKMITKVIINPDGKKLLTTSFDGNIKLWDLPTGGVSTFSGTSDMNINIKFSSDGKYYGWTSMSGVKVCNLSGVFLININRTMSGVSDLDIDRKMIVESAYDVDKNKNPIPMLRIKNLNNDVIKDIKGVSSSGYSVKLSPNGKMLVLGTLDGFVNIMNLSNDQTVSLINDKNEWLCFTPDGFWDSSKNGGKMVAMVQDLEAYSVDQFAIKYNRPDIILQRLETEDKEVINYYYYQYKKRLRKMNFKEEDLSGELHVPEAKIVNAGVKGKFIDLEFNLNDTSYNLKSYNIYINDVPIFGSYGKQVEGKDKNIKESIELSAGKNKIEISCLNEKGAESFRALTTADYTSKVSGDLYYIGFGVSRYKNPDLNLQFADKDAKDLEGAFKKMKGYYGNVYANAYINENVTVESIKKAKDIMKNAKVDDTFVLFIAGHGVHDRDKESTYYFLTYDTDLTDLSKNCADFDLVEDLLQGIPPRNKLFLMDTCESGEVDDETKTEYGALSGGRGIKARAINMRGAKSADVITKAVSADFSFDGDRYINNNLIRRSGSIVFSSCKGGEYSYESEEIKNGYFTHEILNTLAGINKPSAAQGEAVSIDDLRDIVIKSVSIKTDGLQNPTVDRDNIFIKFKFPVVK